VGGLVVLLIMDCSMSSPVSSEMHGDLCPCRIWHHKILVGKKVYRITDYDKKTVFLLNDKKTVGMKGETQKSHVCA
jgi:hypothetical protein